MITARKIKILNITHYFSSHGGGIEIVADRLLTEFASHGVQVVWAASDMGEPLSSIKGVFYAPMYCLNIIEKKTGIPFPIWSPKALRKLAVFIKKADLIVVHDVLYLPNLWGVLCSIFLKRPFVVIQHVGFVPFRNVFLRGLMALGNRTVGRIAIRNASAVVFISSTVRDYFAGILGAKKMRWRLIPNGVDLEQFTPTSLTMEQADACHKHGYLFRFLFVGRFVEKKGIALLRQLAEAMPQVQWVFIGSGPLNPVSWQLENVEVVGQLEQSKLPDWYRQADLLVLPSCGEGFPLVVQEAMACGLPVAISSETAEALPGVKEQVFHAPITGEREDLDVWKDLLSELLVGDVLKDKRPEVAAFVRENWSWERSAEQYLALFEEILSRREPLRS